MSKVQFHAPQADGEGPLQELVSENDDYELWRDKKDGLVYVALRVGGLRRIAQDYKKRKGIDVDVAEYESSSSNHFYARRNLSEQGHKAAIVGEISKLAGSLEDGASKGLVYLFKNNKGYVMHAMPFLVKRIGEDFVVLDFEGMLEGMGGGEFSVAQVEYYHGMQKDNHSCTVFAMDTLKNCLTNESFLAGISERTDRAQLPKMILAQGSDQYSEFLTTEKTEKYVDGGVNRKAIYKGHHYARFLDVEYQEYLGRETKQLVEKIDQKRVNSEERPSQSPILKGKSKFYNPQITSRNSAFIDSERANKFTAQAGHDEQSFKKTFIKNLAKAAKRYHLNSEQVLLVIDVARIRGGIANEINHDVEAPDGVSEDVMLKFSGYVQELNKLSNICSSRNKGLGLRLCYTPDFVTDDKDSFKRLFQSSESRAAPRGTGR